MITVLFLYNRRKFWAFEIKNIKQEIVSNLNLNKPLCIHEFKDYFVCWPCQHTVFNFFCKQLVSLLPCNQFANSVNQEGIEEEWLLGGWGWSKKGRIVHRFRSLAQLDRPYNTQPECWCAFGSSLTQGLVSSFDLQTTCVICDCWR